MGVNLLEAVRGDAEKAWTTRMHHSVGSTSKLIPTFYANAVHRLHIETIGILLLDRHGDGERSYPDFPHG